MYNSYKQHNVISPGRHETESSHFLLETCFECDVKAVTISAFPNEICLVNYYKSRVRITKMQISQVQNRDKMFSYRNVAICTFKRPYQCNPVAGRFPLASTAVIMPEQVVSFVFLLPGIM